LWNLTFSKKNNMLTRDCYCATENWSWTKCRSGELVSELQSSCPEQSAVPRRNLCWVMVNIYWTKSESIVIYLSLFHFSQLFLDNMQMCSALGYQSNRFYCFEYL
jgi:hypothetical protein